MRVGPWSGALRGARHGQGGIQFHQHAPEHGEPASAADDRFCYPNHPSEGRRLVRAFLRIELALPSGAPNVEYRASHSRPTECGVGRRRASTRRKQQSQSHSIATQRHAATSSLKHRAGATPSASEQPTSRRKVRPAGPPNVGHQASHSRSAELSVGRHRSSRRRKQQPRSHLPRVHPARHAAITRFRHQTARRHERASYRAVAAEHASFARRTLGSKQRARARPNAASAGAEPAVAASSSRDPAQSPPSATPPPQSQSRRNAERERAADQPPQSTLIWPAERRAPSIALVLDRAQRQPAPIQPSPQATAAISLASGSPRAPRRHH